MVREATYPMKAKLTIYLDQALIASAKAYARRHGMSVSQLVENYFAVLTAPVGQPSISPLMTRLHGSAKGAEFDKDEYREHLERKHPDDSG